MKNSQLQLALSRRNILGIAASGLAAGLLPAVGWADATFHAIRSYHE